MNYSQEMKKEEVGNKSDVTKLSILWLNRMLYLIWILQGWLAHWGWEE